MPTYGVTAAGFIRPTLEEIRTQLITDFENAIGAPINTGPESLIGQFIGITAEALSLQWQAMESTYNSRYPAAAEGTSLDGAVTLTGITRNPATRSIMDVTITGTVGTVIPAASRIITQAGDDFEFVDSYTIVAGENIAEVRAVVPGPAPVPINSVAGIKTPVSGWLTAQNAEPGQQGIAEETDAQLRNRRELSLQVGGAGTVPAIRARLLEQVADVGNAIIIENRTSAVDADGRPPHSFEVVIAGGIDQEIADKIWESKPAGIETFGLETVTVIDSQGNEQIVKFTRPILSYVWVKVVITQEFAGSVPANYEELVQDALVAYGINLGLGNPILIQALFGPIYGAISGVDTAAVSIATSEEQSVEPDPGDFVTTNIDLPRNEISVWEAFRIEVTLA